MFVYDWEKEYIRGNGYYWEFDEIKEIEKIDIEGIQFVGVLLSNMSWVFFYENDKGYRRLVKNFAEDIRLLGTWLQKYETEVSVMNRLLCSLCGVIWDVYNINSYSILRKCGLKDYIDSSYAHPSEKKPLHVESVENVYEIFSGVLPENIQITRKEALKKECFGLIDIYRSLFGADFEMIQNSESEIVSRLNQINSDMYIVKEKLDTDFTLLSMGMSEGALNDVIWVNRIGDLKRKIFPIVEKEIASSDKEYLLSEYGDILEMKIELKKVITKMPFLDSLELYRDYQEKLRVISAKKRQRNVGECASGVWDNYIKYYHYGSILISDHMNKINKNKGKNKPIPQSEIDAAMIFFYDTSSAEEAYQQRKINDYKINKSAGNAGERSVNYTLKWLDSQEYFQVESRSVDPAGGKCIILKNTKFIDEAQEYDHIIVSAKGIFVIETKNLKGKIIIDEDKNWSREVDGKAIGLTNPLQQIRQHEKVLKSFLPNGIPIISILCIANDQAIIEGSKNFELPIIKSDRLVEFIETYKPEKHLSDKDCKKCMELIYKHMI